MSIRGICISCAALLLMLSLSMSIGALSQTAAENGVSPASEVQTDANGTFNFSHLAPGIYNLTAHKLIIGTMHYMGAARVTIPGNDNNVTISMARADDAHFAFFQNASVNLTPGNYSIIGMVIGPNRPGAEPKEIPYEDTQVKITAAA